MKTIAAALLVALSGKEVTEDAIKAVFKSVGAKENDAEIKSVAAALKGKKPEEVVAEGMKKLSAVPAGGAPEEEHHDDKKDNKGKDKGKDKGKGKDKKEEKKKEEKKEEEDEEDFGLGGLF